MLAIELPPAMIEELFQTFANTETVLKVDFAEIPFNSQIVPVQNPILTS